MVTPQTNSLVPVVLVCLTGVESVGEGEPDSHSDLWIHNVAHSPRSEGSLVPAQVILIQ